MTANPTTKPATTTTATTRRMRAAALAGVSGQVFLVVGMLVAGWLQDGPYSVARHDMSDMAAVGVSHAWVVQLSQGVGGATTVIFAWLAFRPALAGVRGRTQAAVLLTVTWGVGNLSDVFFRVDCRIADGCTREEQVQTWHAAIHSFTSVGLLIFAVTPYLVARCLRRSSQWARLARPSVYFGVGVDVFLVAAIALGEHWGTGYAQRLMLLSGAAWIAMLATWPLWISARQEMAAGDARSDGPMSTNA